MSVTLRSSRDADPVLCKLLGGQCHLAGKQHLLSQVADFAELLQLIKEEKDIDLLAERLHHLTGKDLDVEYSGGLVPQGQIDALLCHLLGEKCAEAGHSHTPEQVEDLVSVLQTIDDRAVVQRYADRLRQLANGMSYRGNKKRRSKRGSKSRKSRKSRKSKKSGGKKKRGTKKRRRTRK